MNIKIWFDNKNFLKKVLGIYLLFSIIPMAAVTVYDYMHTKQLLLEQAYDGIRQNAGTIESSLSSLFQPYETIVAELRADRRLNTYLSLDYTDLSYSELAYYFRTSLDRIIVLYLEIEWIHFYSNRAGARGRNRKNAGRLLFRIWQYRNSCGIYCKSSK